MKTRITFYLSLLLLLAGLALMSGCASTAGGAGGIDLNRLATVAELAADLGGTQLLRAKPEYRPGAVAASIALHALLNTEGSVSPQDFAAALKELNVRQVGSGDSMIYIESAVAVWDTTFGAKEVKLDTSGFKDVRPMVEATSRGLDRALAKTEPK